MILNEGQISETNCPLPSKSFTIKNSPLAFEILSSRLYSNPVLAIIRELLTNAYDSHVIAGKENIPIYVHLPTQLDTNFIIRDYGTGLSKEDILLLYTTFFNSTKNTTNDVTGCFGLGSKTPFSYTSGFIVNSFYEGYEHRFMAVKKDNYPQIIHVNSYKTDEPNGLQIVIPVENKDIALFNHTFKEYIKWIPEIKTTGVAYSEKASVSFYNLSSTDIINDIPYFIQLNLFEDEYQHDYERRYNFRNFYLKQGQNVYSVVEIVNDIFSNDKWYSILASFSSMFNIVLEVAIGTFEITPNREQIDTTQKSKDKLKKLINAIEVNIRDQFMSVLANSTNTHVISLIKSIIAANLDIELTKFKNKNNIHIWTSVNYYDKRVQVDFGNLIDVMELKDYEKQDYLDHNSIETGYTLLISIPVTKKCGKHVKLFNIINNYPEEFKKYDRILINFMHFDKKWWVSTAFTRIYNQVSKLKKLKQLVGFLNSLPELDMRVDITNYNKLLRTHPKQNKVTVVPTVKRHVNKNIMIRFLNVSCMDDDYFYSKIHYEDTKSSYPITAINNINSNNDNETLVIIESRHDKIVKNHNYAYWYYLFTLFGDLKDPVTNERSIVSFLKEQAEKQGIVYKDKVDTRLKYIIETVPSNKKYFTNKFIIDTNDIIDYYQKHIYNLKRYIDESSFISFYSKFMKIIKIFNEPIRTKLLNSTTAKEITLINNLVKKGGISADIYSNDTIEEIQKIVDTILGSSVCRVHKIDLYHLANRLNNVHELLKYEIHSRGYFNRKDSYQTNITMSKQARYQFIDLVLGGKPYVLF